MMAEDGLVHLLDGERPLDEVLQHPPELAHVARHASNRHLTLFADDEVDLVARTHTQRFPDFSG
jgi:hypothetical protein